MTLGFFETHSQTTTTEDEVVPSQAEIEREIAKLKGDSARDVQTQLEQQRSAERKGKIEEDVKEREEEVENRVKRVWKAAEQEVETVIKDAEVDVKRGRWLRERVVDAESKGV